MSNFKNINKIIIADINSNMKLENKVFKSKI